MWDCVTGALKPENVSLNVMVRAARLRSKSTVALALGEKIAPVSALSAPTSSNPENVPWKSVALAFAASSMNGAAITVTNASILKCMRFSPVHMLDFHCDGNFRCGRETDQKPDPTGHPPSDSETSLFNPRLCQLHLTYTSGL